MTPDERLDDIEAAWLKLCGSCDAGLTTACTCSDRDPRQDVNWLAERLRDARAEVERLSSDPNWITVKVSDIASLRAELAAERAENHRLREMWDKSGKNDLIAELAAERAKAQRRQAAIDAANVQLNLAFSEGWRIDHVRAALTGGDR